MSSGFSGAKAATESLDDAAILVIQIRAMGDMLLATPLIREIKARFPKCNLDVLSETLPSQVLRNNPHINRIHIAPGRKAPVKRYYSLIKQLRAANYKLVIDLLSTPGSAVITRLTGAPRRIGYRLRQRTWAYTDPIERGWRPVYNALTKFDLVKSIGIVPSNLRPELFFNPTDREWCEKRLAELDIERAQTVVGLAPFCKRAKRMWEISNWIDLIKRIDQGINPVWLLFASESERDAIKEVETIQSIRVVWAGAPDIILAAGLMQRCKLLLTGENGLLHVAVAARVPTYSFFVGSDGPAQWLPPESKINTGFDLRLSTAYTISIEMEKIVKQIKESTVN
jgi:ADP-heptose:LPS heptosyltransferase